MAFRILGRKVDERVSHGDKQLGVPNELSVASVDGYFLESTKYKKMWPPGGSALLLLFSIILTFTHKSNAVRCYMCASSNDPKNEDHCGAYKKFEKEEHIAVECNSEESPMPGSFCMKLTQQSPIGFIWDGRWRQVIRRCASVADTGVTGVCNWGVYENGVYWEECYCSSDECNSSSYFSILPLPVMLLLPIVYLVQMIL